MRNSRLELSLLRVIRVGRHGLREQVLVLLTGTSRRLLTRGTLASARAAVPVGPEAQLLHLF